MSRPNNHALGGCAGFAWPSGYPFTTHGSALYAEGFSMTEITREAVVPVQQGWQPIETTRKDIGSIMVWCPERENIYLVTWHFNYGWVIFGGDLVLHEKPTLWHHRPASPLKEIAPDGE
jgi:hypothetical protein